MNVISMNEEGYQELIAMRLLPENVPNKVHSDMEIDSRFHFTITNTHMGKLKSYKRQRERNMRFLKVN